MNTPKGKLTALLAIVAAIGLVTATGAFTTVTADRTITVDTAGDANALLSLEGNSSSGGSAYVDTNAGDEIIIDFSQSALPNNAQGLNKNGTTTVSHLLNVTNQGNEAIDFWTTIDVSTTGVSIYFYNNSDTSANVTGSGNSMTIPAGQQRSIGISLEIDSNVDDFNTTVTFHAESQ